MRPIESAERCAGLFALLTLALPWIWLPPRVSAQLRPCSQVVPTSGAYAVQADDILISPREAPEETLLTQTWFALRNNFMKVKLESPKDLCLLRCNARRPSGEQDFPSTLAATLDQDNVVLEIWGGIEREDLGGGIFHTAHFQYALIPMCAHPPSGGMVHGVYRREIVTKPGGTLKETFTQLDQSAVITALLSIATGLKLARIDRFDDAWKFLCQGYLTLKERIGSTPSVQDQRLLNYVRGTATELANRARTSSIESNLKHLPQEDLESVWGEP